MQTPIDLEKTDPDVRYVAMKLQGEGFRILELGEGPKQGGNTDTLYYIVCRASPVSLLDDVDRCEMLMTIWGYTPNSVIEWTITGIYSKGTATILLENTNAQ